MTAEENEEFILEYWAGRLIDSPQAYEIAEEIINSQKSYHKAKVKEPKKFELTFGQCFKCIIEVKGNEVRGKEAMNGWGNPSELTEVKLLSDD